MDVGKPVIATQPVDVKALLERRGFAVVRQLLQPQLVAQVSDAFDRLLAMAKEVSLRDDGEQFVVDRDPFRLHRVVWAGGVNETLAALGADPRFLRLAAAALGRRDVVQLIQQAHYKLPHDNVAFGWHQDASNRRYGTELWRDVDGRGSFVQIALAVDAMTTDNGPLMVIPGSHKRGFVADPQTGAIPASHLDTKSAEAVLLAPGDAVVFGPFVIHGSEANRSEAPRRLFLQGYATPGANGRRYPGCGLGIARVLASS